MDIKLNLAHKEINPGVINLRQYSNKTDILTFVMDEYVYEQTDLSTLKAYAICDKGGWVDEVKLESVVSEKKLRLTWKVTNYTTQNDGWINYFISFKNNLNGSVWNSHKAIIFVNSNTNADDHIAANYPTILQQWEQRMDNLDAQVGVDITEVNKALAQTNQNVVQTNKDASDSKNALNDINNIYTNIKNLVGYEPVDAIGKEVMQARGGYPLLNDRLNALDQIKDHTHTKLQITDFPTNVSSFNNDSKYQNESQVKALISNLVNSAPSTLDTLNELANALGNDPNFATTITNLIGQKSPIGHTHSEYSSKTHSHDVFTGATQYYSGTSGMVPSANAGQQNHALFGDGKWRALPDNTLTVDTSLDSYSGNPIANKTVTAALNSKANSNHNHDSSYATKNHSHNDYANLYHNHDTDYAAKSHTHSGYASSSHNHDSSYASKTHSHSEYASLNHGHSGYATTSDLLNKADKSQLGTQCTFSLQGTTLTITTK